MDLRYDPAYGMLTEVYKRFQAELAVRNNVEPDLVRPTNGATGALATIFSATRIKAAADGIRPLALLASFEYFDAFRMLRNYRYEIMTAQSNPRMYPTQDIIRKLQSEQPVLLYLSVPNNPTGFLISSRDLDEIFNAVPATTRVVLDRTLVHPDTYCGTVYLSERYGTKDLVVVDSFSKSHIMIGQRVGYLVALQPAMVASLHPFACSPNMDAMEEAMRRIDDGSNEDHVLACNKRSDEILREWRSAHARYYPSRSNFALIELHRFSGDKCREKLEKRGILVRTGSQLFLPENYVRIDMGQPEELPKFIIALEDILVC